MLPTEFQSLNLKQGEWIKFTMVNHFDWVGELIKYYPFVNTSGELEYYIMEIRMPGWVPDVIKFRTDRVISMQKSKAPTPRDVY